MRPYYDDGIVTIYHCDSLEILPTLPKAACISDPPYGINYFRKSDSGKGKHSRRNVAPIHGDDRPFDPTPFLDFENVILWGADHYAARLPHGRFLAWDKLNGLESFDSFSDVEFAWHNKTGAARIFRYLWKGICQQGDKKGGRVHPTQKPVPLMAWCIKQAGMPESIVDPFMGSGSTLVAAKQMSIRAVGIEVEEKYCEAAARRLHQSVFNFEQMAA